MIHSFIYFFNCCCFTTSSNLSFSRGPVWEIAGSEFSKSSNHTADGISIRFPRVVRIRDDKDFSNHTNITDLKTLVAASKGGLRAVGEDDEEDELDHDAAAPASPYASPPPSYVRSSN